MSNLNRRSALGKLGLGIASASASLAGAVVISAPTKASTIAPELLRLIEAHRVVYAPFDEANRRYVVAEDVFFRSRESEPAQDKAARESFIGLRDAHLELERVSPAERAATTALCGYRCATVEEEKAKASYILTETSIKHKHIRSDFLGALLN